MSTPDDTGATRSYVLLRLDESAVRAEIAEVIATDETLTSITADDVTDADIHACCAVVEQTDLSEELGRFRLSGIGIPVLMAVIFVSL